MRYTESQLENFSKPLSDSEELRCENMIKMVKEAIKNYYYETRKSILNLDDYEIFLQGSYANNTNVRQNSDVDICVMYKKVFFYHMPTGYSLNGSYVDSDLEYFDLRNNIKEALIKKFGSSRVVDKNKSIRIMSNSNTVDADVVVAFQYRDYINSTEYKEGIYYFALDGSKVINYPKIHLENGKNKNVSTDYMYKKMVRIFKKIMYNMQSDNIYVSKEIKGFVLECMAYNIPNDKFYKYIDNKYSTNLKNMIDIFINEKMEYWKEVNEIKYLFGIEKNKSEDYYKSFIKDMKEYISE